MCILTASAHQAVAQDRSEDADSVWYVALPNVVVTATKGERELRNVPILTDVITGDDALVQGSQRLTDLLAEQTGLALVQDFRMGVQLQGLDPAYTLVLIDGQPLIGREGGTLDLDRIGVAGIERVEIVRGPLSSLYGSEALAGVINIITREPREGVQGGMRASYETHNTMDVALSADAKYRKLASRLELNRYSSSGYDLFPDLLGLTVPGFVDYNASAKLRFEQNDRTSWQLNSRYGSQSQNSTSGLFLNGILVEFDEEATRTDWSVAPQVTHIFPSAMKLTGGLYAAGYDTRSVLRDRLNAETTPGETNFNQLYQKAEVQLDGLLGKKHIVAIGRGYINEQVEADRVRGGKRSNSDAYGFLQYEWVPNDIVDVIVSSRLDAHSDYGARMSPKAALLVRPLPELRLRTSVGSGFKAPTFQQLYMDFTNPAAGYSVLGSVDIVEAIDELEALGLIDYYLADPTTIVTTRPESAVAYNVGLDADLGDKMYVQFHLFRSDVKDLIETTPIAVKTNGQSVFTYVNLNRIYSQGLDAEVRLEPLPRLQIGIGYQFLDARDRDVVNDIEAGVIYKRVNGRDRRVRPDEYGGLFNRSRHSGIVRLRYRFPEWGMTASVRGIFRGRYGFADRNGNLILDDDSEYVHGYALWNTTLTKELGSSLVMQVGVKNAFGELNPEYIPSLSGRLLFASLQYTLNP